MKNEKVFAAINMFSILRSIEDLVNLDEEAKEIVKGTRLTMKFIVPSLPKFYLVFTGSRVKAKVGGNLESDINLAFLNSSHFNKMMAGESMPIPTKGVSKIVSLKMNLLSLPIFYRPILCLMKTG